MPPMPRHASTESGSEPIVDADVVDEVDGSTVADETAQGVPVLAEVRAIQAHSPVSLPAVQAAAVAATGFVAGAATLALVRRHSARKHARSRQPRRALDALPIVGSRSFLVDVHLIAKPD